MKETPAKLTLTYHSLFLPYWIRFLRKTKSFKKIWDGIPQLTEGANPILFSDFKGDQTFNLVWVKIHTLPLGNWGWKEKMWASVWWEEVSSAAAMATSKLKPTLIIRNILSYVRCKLNIFCAPFLQPSF